MFVTYKPTKSIFKSLFFFSFFFTFTRNSVLFHAVIVRIVLEWVGHPLLFRKIFVDLPYFPHIFPVHGEGENGMLAYFSKLLVDDKLGAKMRSFGSITRGPIQHGECKFRSKTHHLGVKCET